MRAAPLLLLLVGCVADDRVAARHCHVHDRPLLEETLKYGVGNTIVDAARVEAEIRDFPFERRTRWLICVAGPCVPSRTRIRHCPACSEAGRAWDLRRERARMDLEKGGLPMPLLVTTVLLCLGVQEKMDNPQYTHWKSCKPGSWVKHKMVFEAGGQAMQSEVVSTLLEVTPEKVVIESKTSMDFGGRKMEVPAQKKDVLAQVEKKEGQTPPSEKDEDIVVDGKTYKCRAFEFEQAEKGQTVKGKGWVCADVPGGMVKSEFNSPQLPKPMLMTVVAFEKK